MRVILLSIILFFIIFCTSTAQWRLLNEQPTYGFAANPKNPKTLFVGGIGRQIFRSYDAGNTWDTLVVEFKTGTTRFTNIFIHPVDTNIIIIGGLGFGTIMRSKDAGNSWDTVSIVPEVLSPLTLPGESIIADVNNSDIIYAADLFSSSIYRSLDRGLSWDSISSIRAPALCTITMLPNGSMFAGCTGGTIHKSIDAGFTWRQVAKVITNEGDDAEIPRIVFSKRNPLVGYAVASYFYYLLRPSGGLFTTEDGGETWRLISFADTSLWSLAVRTIGTEDEVFVGGYTDDFGAPQRVPGQGIVRRSQNSGKNWLRIDQTIAWTDTIHRNAWMMKFVGDLRETERLYMATEAGFFVMDEPSDINNKLLENDTDMWDALLQNNILSISYPKEFSDKLNLSVELTSLIGERIFKTIANGERVFQVQNCPKGIVVCEISDGFTRKHQLLISE
ncbi:MAG: exo-alpha-sialidase [Ignavibacteria bacterium]|nr:exo-alpha-sialidase [Ignavibacteria bacterium]